jgi:hypothetical protein
VPRLVEVGVVSLTQYGKSSGGAGRAVVAVARFGFPSHSTGLFADCFPTTPLSRRDPAIDKPPLGPTNSADRAMMTLASRSVIVSSRSCAAAL